MSLPNAKTQTIIVIVMVSPSKKTTAGSIIIDSEGVKMSKISIKINRNNLYVADYDSASKTVHSNDDFTNRVAFDFLYRLFVEVVLRD
jgi:hypothetical protein